MTPESKHAFERLEELKTESTEPIELLTHIQELLEIQKTFEEFWLTQQCGPSNSLHEYLFLMNYIQEAISISLVTEKQVPIPAHPMETNDWLWKCSRAAWILNNISADQVVRLLPVPSTRYKAVQKDPSIRKKLFDLRDQVRTHWEALQRALRWQIFWERLVTPTMKTVVLSWVMDSSKCTKLCVSPKPSECYHTHLWKAIHAQNTTQPISQPTIPKDTPLVATILENNDEETDNVQEITAPTNKKLVVATQEPKRTRKRKQKTAEVCADESDVQEIPEKEKRQFSLHWPIVIFKSP